jgi:hypothetical protein
VAFARLRRSSFVAMACLALAGCGAKSSLGVIGDHGGTGGGTGGGVSCNTLSDDSPTISPVCPMGSYTCPDCPDMMGTGGPVLDGTYFMSRLTVWGSACGELANANAHATLEIHGGTMDLLSTGPSDLDPTHTVTTRASFSFVVAGTNLDVTELCPMSASPSVIAYASDGHTLILAGLSGVDGTPTFKRQ